MSPLTYLMRRTLVNTVKGIFRKPIVLVGYLFVAAFVILMVVTAFTMPNGSMNHGSPELFRAVMTGVFAIIVYFSLRFGIDKGSTYFRMADVNLVFTSPLRPNQVLVYGFLKQLGGTALLMFIALCQIPNIKNQFDMQPYGPLIILLVTLMYMFAYPVFAMLVYSWSSKSRQRRRIGKWIIDGLALVTVLLFLWQLAQTRKIDRALIGLFDNDVVNWVPLVGWIRMVLTAAVDGITPLFWLGLGITVAVVAGFTYLLYRMNLDYYEDVLEATEYTEAAFAAKREGRNMQFGLKVRSGVKQRLSGGGGRAIFSKVLLEMRKTSFFLFIDRTTIAVVIASIAFRLFLQGGDSQDPSTALFTVLCFSVYMLFLFTIQGRWALELSKPYIFLVPAPAPEKLFYATLADHLKNLLDGALLFGIAGVLFHAGPAAILACIFSYVCFGAVFLYGDVLARRIFGAVHAKTLMMFLKLLLTLLILVPGIVLVVIVAILTKESLFLFFAFGGWALFAAGVLFLLSQGILNQLEAAD